MGRPAPRHVRRMRLVSLMRRRAVSGLRFALTERRGEAGEVDRYLEESPTRGQGRRSRPGKPRGKVPRKRRPKRARGLASELVPARVEGCGERAPASRRRAGQADPPGARPSRSADAPRRAPGPPQGREAPLARARSITASDRIRLTDRLRRGPRSGPSLALSSRLWFRPTLRGEEAGVALPSTARKKSK